MVSARPRVTWSANSVPVGTVPSLGADGRIRPITGAAVSADGTLAALRTKKDVFVYRVDDGDVADTFTRAPDLVLPAPDRPQGEAVAFTDDHALLLASEADKGPLPPLHMVADLPDRLQAADRSVGVHVSIWALLTGAGVAVVGGAFWLRRRS